MSQMTDHDHDSKRDPWAAPQDTVFAPTSAQTPAQTPAPASAPAPGTHPTQPLGGYGWPPATPPSATDPFSPYTPATGPAGSGPVPPAPLGPDHGKDRGRPGWTGVLAVGAGAAVLSSLLTAGAFTALGDRTVTTTTPAASQSQGTAQQTAPLVTGSSTTPNWNAVAAAVEPSVVSVRVATGNGNGGEGSGVVFDTKGHILTNNHVVAEAGSGGSIQVVLSDGRTYAATIVGTDPSTDLAVIKVTSPPSDLKPATFGNSDAVKVGDQVMAAGNPLGLSDTVTTGIVSALNRPVTTTASSQQQQDPFGFGQQQAQSEQVVTNAIQTDAAINPGNSGGALVDSSGRVIGITSSIASLGSSFGGSQSGSIGLGFAIPVNEAKSVAQQLIDKGSVQHAYLGVTLADGTVSIDGAQRQAAVVGTVNSGTPAAQGGLKAKDAVIAIDGQALDGADSLVARIRALEPGRTVTLTVVRNGAKVEVPVTLAVRPSSNN